MGSGVLGDHGGVLRDTNLQVLILAGTVSPLAVSLISPVFDVLIGTFGASPETIGLLVSAYTAPGVVAIPIAGGLSDRYGRKRVLLAGLLLFGGAGAAISLTTAFEIVLALRVIQGIGAAGVTPVVVTAIGDLYGDREAAAAQGFRLTAVGSAQATLPLVAALLVVVAWQLPFLMYAMALPVAIAVYVYFEEADRTSPSARDADPSYRRRLCGQLARPRVAALVVAYGGPVFLYFAFQTAVSLHLVRVLGGSPGIAGVVVALFSAVYAVAATQAGRATARFATRYRPLILANATMAVGLIGFAAAPALPVAVLGVGVFGVGYGLTSSLYRSVLPELPPAGLRGGVVSTAEALSRLGAAVSPVLAGLLIGGLRPVVGFTTAIRWAVGTLALFAGVLGVATVLFAAGRDGDA